MLGLVVMMAISSPQLCGLCSSSRFRLGPARRFSRNAPVFIVLSGLVVFGWGEIFSLFPSTLTDAFGSPHATTNYGFLCIAQGVGSILGGRSPRL